MMLMDGDGSTQLATPYTGVYVNWWKELNLKN